MRSALVVTCAIGFGAILSAQQPQTQQPSQQQPSSQQQPMQQPSQQGQAVTLTGCVVQASDQPTMFALRQIEAGSGQAAQRAPGQPADPAGAAGQSGATGTAGTAGTAGARGGAQGAWYRLTPQATQDLKQYTGRAVRVMGTIVPGKDEKGADVVIHRVQPDKMTVTAIDLKPAPQLRIQSITPATGSCEAKPGA